MVRDTAMFNISEVKAVYKTKTKPSQRIKITSSEDAFEVIKKSIHIDEQEHIERVYVILLNRNNRVLGVSHISDGGISGCMVDPKVIFQRVLTANASSFIMWHNHPSGTMTASRADIDICQKLDKGAKILNLTFLDSLIIDSEGNYRSMRDNNDF